MADIGIKKTRMGINFTFILIFIALVIICAIMWGMYQANYRKASVKKNGIEVEAECTDCARGTDEITHHLIYFALYTYENESGKIYYVERRFSTEEKAHEQLGKKIHIIIDPYDPSHRGWDCDMEYIRNLPVNFERDFALAIVFCFPVPLALYLLIYRGIYRSAMNYKIRKKVGDNDPDFMGGKRYNIDAIKTGEVTKVWKWIVCYVKVKYQDETGATREKWARSWFTHKEAKFLQQKKTINIVPYKNTYGILEEM